MGELPTGAGDHEDAEHGLPGGSGGGADVDSNACPFCGFAGEHITGYGFAAGAGIGSYTYCGNDQCEKLIEYMPDLEGVDEKTAARINATVEEWRAGLPPQRPGNADA